MLEAWTNLFSQILGYLFPDREIQAFTLGVPNIKAYATRDIIDIYGNYPLNNVTIEQTWGSLYQGA